MMLQKLTRRPTTWMIRGSCDIKPRQKGVVELMAKRADYADIIVSPD